MRVVVPVLEMHEQLLSDTRPPTVARKTRPIVMDDDAASIEEALARNGADLTAFLWGTADLLGDRWPWAWIFFPQCYPLASHVRSVRREQAELPFTLYGREPDPLPPRWTPCVGAAMPMTKEVLERAASRSPMFESAWRLLADCSASTYWACLSDALDRAWVDSVRDPNEAPNA